MAPASSTLRASIITFPTLLLLSLLLRLLLILWSTYQDTHSQVKYTDIDYLVFTNAAAHVANGDSPYQRATYRYTPLLSWLLVPGEAFGIREVWGKLLFASTDLGAGALIYSLLITHNRLSTKRAVLYTSFWLLNPFVATISTRGNAESIMSLLVLGCIYALLKRRIWVSAVLLGVGVHVKIYPIIYALPMWLNLREGTWKGKGVTGKVVNFFSWERLGYGFVSAGIFFGLSAWMYIVYGQEFLEHTYLYHITRQDHRHNFSLYFYHLYLHSTSIPHSSGASMWGLLAFLPQMSLVAYLGFTLAKRDLTLACFAQTFAFVMLNKVVTSQYFMWYLSFLPLLLPSSRLMTTHSKLGMLMVVSWVLGQGVWLGGAYQLEFLGENRFRWLFGGGLLFAGVNAWVLGEVIKNHSFSSAELEHKTEDATGKSRGETDQEPSVQSKRVTKSASAQKVKVK
ncbi:GPI mannosyltransferase 1 [Chytridiales sp. JEL 0842]|nr:GPI mannosyltransferase 1 [Chytridiales sp. JEL 0842]